MCSSDLDEILHAIAKTTPLKVLGRSSSLLLRGEEKSAVNVAARLGATHVLDGSVRKASGRVRITAQLIETANAAHVWAERYDRTLDDIFAIQDEISQSIVEALKVRLAPAEKQAIRQRLAMRSAQVEACRALIFNTAWRDAQGQQVKIGRAHV